MEKGLSVVRENSRRQIIGLGPDTFYKSMTRDSAHRLDDFYTLLDRASPVTGFVPRLIAVESIDDEVSVACFEYVNGRGGTTRDTNECLNLYAELHASAQRHSTRAAQAVIDVCRDEVSTWSEELLHSWDPANWTDPKILHWAGADATALTEIGVPALRSVGNRLAALEPEGMCAPVHADLYVGNYMCTASGQGVIFDWDEGYWGLPGMGLQILLREAMDDGIEDLGYESLLKRAPQLAAMGLGEHDLAIRTLASAVVEIAGVRQSLRELGRTRERHAAYLAAWACRYEWVIRQVRA